MLASFSSDPNITPRMLLEQIAWMPGVTVHDLGTALGDFPRLRTRAIVDMLRRARLVTVDGEGSRARLFARCTHGDLAARRAGIDLDRPVSRW